MAAMSFTSCGDREDTVQKPTMDGSIVTTLSTTHLTDSFDVLVTSFDVYKANKLVSKHLYRDTIPSLGLISVEVDSADNTVDKKIKRDYEFFVTLK